MKNERKLEIRHSENIAKITQFSGSRPAIIGHQGRSSKMAFDGLKRRYPILRILWFTTMPLPPKKLMRFSRLQKNALKYYGVQLLLVSDNCLLASTMCPKQVFDTISRPFTPPFLKQASNYYKTLFPWSSQKWKSDIQRLLLRCIHYL